MIKKWIASLGVILGVGILAVSCAQSIVRKESPQIVRGEVHVNLVKLSEIDPDIVVDFRYATDDNFLKKGVYPRNEAFIINSAGQRLKRVNDRLEEQGFGLKVWEAYRPPWVQKEMWKILPDDRYVADPSLGSRHNRGCAVDVTLVDAQGNELEMPTLFDDFSEKAHPEYSDVSPIAIRNRQILRAAMMAEVFEPFPTEWWHFDDPNWRDYPILDVNPY